MLECCAALKRLARHKLPDDGGTAAETAADYRQRAAGAVVVLEDADSDEGEGPCRWVVLRFKSRMRSPGVRLLMLVCWALNFMRGF